MIGWLFAGVVVGIAHAILLARAVRRGPSAGAMLGRIALAAAFLVGAACAGALAGGALGWTSGLVAGVAVARARLG